MLASVVAFALGHLGAHQAPDFTPDLDALIAAMREDGAYVREDGIDFPALDAAYRPRFAAAATRRELLPVLEAFVGELHDPHASLGSNNDHSPRLVPSGADLMGIWRGERAFVEEARPGSLAAEAGILAGDEILTIGGEPVRKAAAEWLGVQPPGKRGWEWALDAALAGREDVPRRFALRHASGETKGTEYAVALGTARDVPAPTRLTVIDRPGRIVVLRPENSLGQDELIRDVEATLPRLRAARGIVLDLRDTPSGGNTAVARGIMGLFLSRRLAFQRHVYEERATDTRRDWVEYATPRLKEPVQTRMVVLVDRWTGSMGEGLAIGLDATRRATIVGTRMAGLRGAISGLTLPVSGLRVQFPTEALFHPNGTPRHLWTPPVRISPGPGDPWITEAERILRR